MRGYTRNLNQTAVYWGSPTSDGMGGYEYDDCIEINCRWESKLEKYIDEKGEEKLSRAIVFVNQDLDIGGLLYLGEITDLPSYAESSPNEFDNTYRIMGFESIPNLRNNFSVRRAIL